MALRLLVRPWTASMCGSMASLVEQGGGPAVREGVPRGPSAPSFMGPPAGVMHIAPATIAPPEQLSMSAGHGARRLPRGVAERRVMERRPTGRHGHGEVERLFGETRRPELRPSGRAWSGDEDHEVERARRTAELETRSGTKDLWLAHRVASPTHTPPAERHRVRGVRPRSRRPESQAAQARRGIVEELWRIGGPGVRRLF